MGTTNPSSQANTQSPERPAGYHDRKTDSGIVAAASGRVQTAPTRAEPENRPGHRVQGYPGRVVHGEDWPKHGRELILAQSDGRTETSAQLTQAEVERIISLLRQEQQEAA